MTQNDLLLRSSVICHVPQSEYLVVLEVGSQTPVSVNRISDRDIRFENWQVAFNSDGTYIAGKSQ